MQNAERGINHQDASQTKAESRNSESRNAAGNHQGDKAAKFLPPRHREHRGYGEKRLKF
jgi:hypothetical protein